MERRKTISNINPNEWMKYHRRQRRYSSNDLNHGNHFHLPSDDQPVVNSEQLPHLPEVHHSDHPNGHEIYEIHLFDDSSGEIHHRHQNHLKPPSPQEMSHESSKEKDYYFVPSAKRKELPPSHKHDTLDHKSAKHPLSDHLSSKHSNQNISQRDHIIQIPVHPHVDVPAVDKAVEETTILNCKAAKAAKPGEYPIFYFSSSGTGPRPQDLEAAIPPKKLFIDYHAPVL